MAISVSQGKTKSHKLKFFRSRYLASSFWLFDIMFQRKQGGKQRGRGIMINKSGY